jgi:hypothetical protein
MLCFIITQKYDIFFINSKYYRFIKDTYHFINFKNITKKLKNPL